MADDVASDADHKQIAHALVEQHLRRDARIGAADDHGFGKLNVGERAKIGRRAARILGFASDKTLVAPHQIGQHIVGGELLFLLLGERA